VVQRATNESMYIHCKTRRQFTAHICQVIFARQDRAKPPFLTAIPFFISCHIISHQEMWDYIAPRTTAAAAQLYGSIWYSLLMKLKKNAVPNDAHCVCQNCQHFAGSVSVVLTPHVATVGARTSEEHSYRCIPVVSAMVHCGTKKLN
jgi:hypothetical protein